jgi:hypothetical protein
MSSVSGIYKITLIGDGRIYISEVLLIYNIVGNGIEIAKFN